MMEALGREDLSPEDVELIQGWIVCGESAGGEGDALMDAILDRMFTEHRYPTGHARESFARLSEKLGLPDDNARTGRRVPLRKVLLRVAAVLVPLAVLGGGALWFFTGPASNNPPTDPATFATTMVEAVRNEGGMVILPDGSTVRPVGDSRVTVAEDFDAHRHVILSGEAFFSVTRNAERPFTVEAEELTVTVLGTEFNVKAWAGESEKVVSLVSGSVEIEGGGQSVELMPMERFVYDNATGEGDVAPFTSGQIDRWRFGRMEIDDLSLEQALRAVGDFYDKKVEIEGGLPENRGVTTILDDDVAIGEALEAIRLINDVFEYTLRGDTILIVGEK